MNNSLFNIKQHTGLLDDEEIALKGRQENPVYSSERHLSVEYEASEPHEGFQEDQVYSEVHGQSWDILHADL